MSPNQTRPVPSRFDWHYDLPVTQTTQQTSYAFKQNLSNAIYFKEIRSSIVPYVLFMCIKTSYYAGVPDIKQESYTSYSKTYLDARKEDFPNVIGLKP